MSSKLDIKIQAQQQCVSHDGESIPQTLSVSLRPPEYVEARQQGTGTAS